MSVFTTKPSRSKRKRSASAFVLAAGLGLLSVVPATVASADPLVPVGQNIYLADLVSSTPAWFDASDQTWKTLTLPNDSSAVVVSPDAKTVYYNSPTAEAVFEVDAESAALVRTIPLGVNAGFIGGPLLALDPSGSHLYVAGVNGVVSRIDTATGTVTGSIDVGGQLGGVATSQDGATVYVAGWADNTLVELVAATMTVTRTTPVDNDPQGLQISPDGASLYIGHTAVTNATSAALTVLDTATAAKQWTVTRNDYGAIQGPSVLALSADGSKLYGVDRLSGHAVVDTATRISTRGTLPLSATPFPYMGLTADSRTALFSMSANGITYLDTATNAFSPAEARGTSAGGVAFAPDQAPIAEFTATPGNTGKATTFDASGSTAEMCPIGTYDWNFGDGATATVTTPTVEHTYSAAGDYSVQLTLTTVCGTSTTTVFTGQNLARNGGPSAVTSTSVSVADATPTTPPTTPPTTNPPPTTNNPKTTVPTTTGGSADGVGAEHLATTGGASNGLIVGAVIILAVGAVCFVLRRRNSAVR